MAIHSPLPAIGVPADPVFCVALLAPAYKEHRVSLRNPAVALLYHGLATWCNSLSLFITYLLDTFLRDYTALIVCKSVIGQKLDGNWPISEDVLHHLDL